MAGVTQGDCSANVRSDGGRWHYRVLLAHVRWEPQEDFELQKAGVEAWRVVTDCL